MQKLLYYTLGARVEIFIAWFSKRGNGRRGNHALAESGDTIVMPGEYHQTYTSTVQADICIKTKVFFLSSSWRGFGLFHVKRMEVSINCLRLTFRARPTLLFCGQDRHSSLFDTSYNRNKNESEDIIRTSPNVISIPCLQASSRDRKVVDRMGIGN